MHRAKISAAYMMEKSRFQKDIAALRNRNADISLLRNQLRKAERQPRSSTSGTKEVQSTIKRLAMVRSAAEVLHQGLRTAWSCLDTTHSRHWAKICLECDRTGKTNHITLDMAFSSESSAYPQQVSMSI